MTRKRIKLIGVPWDPRVEVPTLSLAALAAVTLADCESPIVDVPGEPLWVDERVDQVGIPAATPSINATDAIADRYHAKAASAPTPPKAAASSNGSSPSSRRSSSRGGTCSIT